MKHGGQEEGGRSFQESKVVCWLKNCLLFKFLKIGARPINIAYPLPLASFLAFSLSKSGFFELFISYFFCFSFFTAINLWNHINDAEDDIKERRDALFLLERRREAILMVLLLYSLSTSLLIFSKDSLAIPLFFICTLLTWLYSDKIFIGKKLKRLKEDYRTELFTYIIVTPTFFALIWTFFSSISILGILFSLILASIYFSAILLKDIKDVTSDIVAGYRTLAVVFSPQTLFKYSASLLLATILSILFFSIIGVFPKISALTVLIIIPILYSIISIRKLGWELSFRTLKAIKIYTMSFPTTIALFTILSFEI
ncbi:MAG: UbiA family prenyltransferase [Archaeoglobaceae archaeon]|nr:UbiA family prenyltransferase [Archaeoglobaceae archaeon]